MTELYIDGIAAVLPRDFSIQVKRENPLFTKNGEYTYDITLQLSNPTNAALYSHLNRLNTTGWPTEKRKAILIADNRVYCNGTEVITAWTDDSVSIQVASGNSELNYIAGGGTTLGELDMIQTTPTAGTWQEHVEKTFPEVEWCLPVVVDEEGGEVCNAVRFDFYPVFPVTVTRPVEGATLRPQPFLCAFIRSLFTALGYRLVHNSLEDTEFRLLYMLNTKSDDWAEMFAGWKVVDFLDAVEKLFNGTFVIDNKLKEARFLFNTAYYAGTETIHVAAVSDVYEAEVEDESDALDYARARVSYPGGGSYWKMQCLDDGYLEQARLIDIPADFALEAQGESMSGIGIHSGDVIFFVAADIVDNGEIAAVVVGEEVTLKRVYYYPNNNKLILNSENPAFEPLVYIGSELDEIRIIGRAIAQLRKL